MEINVRIKELREKNGYTQKNIADFLSVDQSFVSKIENGERSLTSDMISNLSALFGTTVLSLLNDTGFTSTDCAFRASELTSNDLQTIAFINRIAINADFMARLMQKKRPLWQSVWQSWPPQETKLTEQLAKAVEKRKAD